MEASLAVPTATSVRDIPAKLVADNRLVMNNHLKRGRGGKISFTHIIGYAIVKAAAALPEMNVAYTEIDGKPGVVRHHDVNLGLAIDMTKDDGSRQLLVPSIKGAQNLDFAQFWAAYEDVVRRARANKLTADDFAGTTITLTNPGTLGHGAFGAAAHAGSGLHRRRRRDGVRRAVPGRVGRDAGQSRGEQGHDASPRPTTTG